MVDILITEDEWLIAEEFKLILKLYHVIQHFSRSDDSMFLTINYAGAHSNPDRGLKGFLHGFSNSCKSQMAGTFADDGFAVIQIAFFHHRTNRLDEAFTFIIINGAGRGHSRPRRFRKPPL